MGQPSRSTMLFQAAAGTTNSSAPATTTVYDALGRPTLLTDGGGGTISYTYTGNDVLQVVGPAPSGEHTKQKQFEYDGLGRLSSVCEVTAGTSAWPGGNCAQTNPTTGYWTKYTYDALGNLTGVTQNAQGSSQARAYTYDFLSRLTSEINPENSTTSNPVKYTYDSDSTCGTSNGDLVKRFDALSNVICYAYDAMHRNTQISYPSGPYSGVTPTKYLVYDGATVDGQNMGYTKGRLAEAYTGSPTSKTTDIGFTYSARGEVGSTWESTPHSGGYYQSTAAYWANGALQNLWISQIPSISYNVDGEGRMSTVSASSGQNPVTAVQYATSGTSEPIGALTQVTFGSSDSDVFTSDPNTGRMTQYTYSVNGKAEIGKLGWNPNWTLGSLGITDPINSGDTQNCTYSHDDLIRIAGVNCQSVWGQTFAYDPFGNIDKTVTSTGIAWQPTYNLKNQYQSLSGFTPSYDAAGNLLADSFHNYTWDAEGKVSTIDSTDYAFTYDALGRNVEQNRSGTYYQVVYSPLGTKLGIFSGQTLQEGFVPLPGQVQAEYLSWGLSDYRHPDWLGSDRLESTTSHAIVSAAAYAPFGEPYAQSGSYGDLSFTGANKDTLWLDYDFLAREYDPKQGRWIGPDPAGLAAVDSTNPQSWNRYAYVMNNPLANIDPLGLCQTVTSFYNPNTGVYTFQTTMFPCIPPPVGCNYTAAGGSAEGSQWTGVQCFTPPVPNCPPNGYAGGPGCNNPPQVGNCPSGANCGSQGGGAPANTITATISAGDPNWKKNYCSHQADMAALEAILPYGHLVLGNDYRPSAVLGGTAEIASHVGPELAAGSKALQYSIRSSTGLPMSISQAIFEGVGYAALAYTAYSALKAAQVEMKACMSD
jgi:RHS repeat-associated protein